MECKSRMILSIRKLLIDRRKACVRFLCIVKGVEKFSMRLGGGLELTKFGSFEIVRNSVNVGSETAECICDNVCFPAWYSTLKLYAWIDRIQRMTRLVAEVDSFNAELTRNCVDGLLSDLIKNS